MSEHKLKRKPKELILLKQLIDGCKLDEADQLIRIFEEEGGHTLHDIVLWHLLKCELLLCRGLYEDVVKLAEQTHKESLGLGKNLLSVDILLIMAEALSRLFQRDKSHDIIRQGEKLLKSLTQELPAEYKQREAHIAFLKGLVEGDFDQALYYCKQSLSIKEITKRNRLVVLGTLADIYYLKSKMNRSLKYRQQAIALAEELNITDLLIKNLFMIGVLYRVIGKKDQAVEYFKRSLTLSEKWDFNVFMAMSLSLLILTYIDENSHEKAIPYFSLLSELYDKTKDKGDILSTFNKSMDISFYYLFSKAYMMKTSKRMRDRVEAQALYKELIHRFGEDSYPDYALILCLINLCDLLLEELSMYNDPELLDEIAPLISKLLATAKETGNYVWLAETKLLQAKLALIKLNVEEAKKLMVQAQNIAEIHGLSSLAWGISSEHDVLLKQISNWDNLKDINAPMTDRIKLASIGGVIDRIQGKSTLKPPESIDEQSTVLLILAEGGVLVFSYPFSEEWKIDEDLFSSFLAAFTSFSTEFFSKGLDRAKFGDDLMLMESIDSLSFCYLFKGQTYIAKQKLTKFTEEVQNNTSLWQSLEKHHKSSQILELKESPQLKSLITEIFISKS